MRLVLVLERHAAPSRDQLAAAIAGALPDRSVVSIRVGQPGHELLTLSTLAVAPRASIAVSDVRASVVAACERSGRRVATNHEHVTEALDAPGPQALRAGSGLGHRQPSST